MNPDQKNPAPVEPEKTTEPVTPAVEDGQFDVSAKDATPSPTEPTGDAAAPADLSEPSAPAAPESSFTPPVEPSNTDAASQSESPAQPFPQSMGPIGQNDASPSSTPTNFSDEGAATAQSGTPGRDLGIASFATSFPAPLVGLVLGIIALKKSKGAGYKNNLALAGTIISGATLLLGLISALIIVPAIMSTIDEFSATLEGLSGLNSIFSEVEASTEF